MNVFQSLATTGHVVEAAKGGQQKQQDESSSSQPLKVIYAGLGRFGTTSLQRALTRLGYKTTHGTVMARDLGGKHAKLGKALMDANIDEILEETSKLGYNATTTSHNIYWREMVERSPNAKIIFMTRDFDSWFKSLSLLLTQLLPLQRFPLRSISFFRRVAQYTEELTLRSFEDDYSLQQIKEILHNPAGSMSRSAYQRVHDDFVADMTKTLAKYPNRAFLFDKAEGYPMLCKILEIPQQDCPSDEPFPHATAAKVVKKQGTFLRALEGIVVVVPVMILLLLLRRISSNKKTKGKTS